MQRRASSEPLCNPMGVQLHSRRGALTRPGPLHGGPRRYVLDPTWPAMLALGLPPQYEPAEVVEVWELAQHGTASIRSSRWGFRVDAVRVLASVPLHAFRHGGEWPYSGDLKPRTAAVYRLAERDLLTLAVRQGRSGQLAVLPLRQVAATAPGTVGGT